MASDATNPRGAAPIVFAPVQHPVLSQWSARAIAIFQKEHEVYLLKLNDQPGNTNSLSLKNCVDPQLLQVLVGLGVLKTSDGTAVKKREEVDDEVIKQWMNETVEAAKKNFSTSDLVRIVSHHTVDVNGQGLLVDAVRSFFVSLQVAAESWCPDALHDHSEFIIPVIVRQLDPPTLQGTIRDRIRADEARLRKGPNSYREFVNECLTIASTIDALSTNTADFPRELGKRRREGGSNGPPRPKRPQRDNKPRTHERRSPTRRSFGTHGTGGSGNDRRFGPSGSAESTRGPRAKHMDRQSPHEMPACLNPDCSGYHYMRDCRHPTSTEERKRDLVAQYLRKRDGTARARRLGDGLVSFRATLGHGSVTTTLAADTQSNVCLLPTSTMEELRRTGAEVVKLATPTAVQLAMGAQGSSYPAQGLLTSSVCVNVSLQVSHGRALNLRDVTFFAGEGVDSALLSGPVLSACGLDVASILTAAAEREATIDCRTATSILPEGAGTVTRRLVTYSELQGLDETEEADAVLLEFGEDDPGVLATELDKRVDAALDDGFPRDLSDDLRKLIHEYADVFALRLGATAAADVEPMRIRLKPGARPFRAKVRPYPGRRREILSHMTTAMVRYAMAWRNPTSAWACAPLLVPKDPPVHFRFTVDLRPVNAQTVPEIWPLPHLDSVTDQLRGSTSFASLDFCSGYWQLPLHTDDQHLHSFITPDGVFTPTRTMQGAVNSGANFQRSVAPLFEERLPGHVLAYLDDIMIHFPSPEDHLRGLRQCFDLCRERRLTLSARKTSLYGQRTRWCGRLITPAGTSLDPRRASALRDMHEPRSPAELSTFVHAVTWMSKHLPRFAETVAPLRAALEDAYTRAGRRTKHALKRVSHLLWGSAQREAYAKLQEQLRHTIELAHVNPTMTVCVFTDASDYFWSSVITQTSEADLQLPRDKQRDHEPLVFASGEFKGSQRAWSTFDKEAYAIFRSFMDHGYLIEGNPSDAHLFTDHRNLMYVYSPTLFDATLGKHVITRVQRWAIFISKFRYVIEHVPGEDNIVADMLTRWTRGYRDTKNKDKADNADSSEHRQETQGPGVAKPGRPNMLAARSARRYSKMTEAISLIPTARPDTVRWPSVAEIKHLQDMFETEDGQDAPSSQNRDELLVTRFGQIWIPFSDPYKETHLDIADMQVRILCVGHAGAAGHRSVEATLNRIRGQYWWKGLEDDVSAFVHDCIHCLAANNGERIPRPLASAIHANRPFEVIHFDYLFIGPSKFTYEGVIDPKYLLLIKDDLTSFSWLVPTRAPDALSAADALSRWEASFGPATYWVSDGGSHFTASILKRMRDSYRHVHHVTTAYCPQANGTIERLCREVLRSLRALESEFRLGSQDWPSLTNMLQNVMNMSYLRRLGRSPIEAAFGRNIRSYSLRPTGSKELLAQCNSITEAHARQLVNIRMLLESLDEIHKETVERVSKRRLREIATHNRLTKVRPSGFEVGDFVMVRALAGQISSKTKCRWTGPRRISASVPDHDEVYEVEHLLTHKKAKIHSSRLARFREGGELSEADVERLEHYASHSDSEYFVIETISDLRQMDGRIQALVKWLGYPDERDWTWEPIESLYEDVPEMVRTFLQGHDNTSMKRKALEAIRAV